MPNVPMYIVRICRVDYIPTAESSFIDAIFTPIIKFLDGRMFLVLNRGANEGSKIHYFVTWGLMYPMSINVHTHIPVPQAPILSTYVPFVHLIYTILIHIIQFVR